MSEFLRPEGTYTCVCGLLAMLLSGCGSDSGKTNNSNGQVTAEWRDFCVAKFTQDVPFTAPWGDVVFTAKTGEEYLLNEYGSFGTTATAKIMYLTSAGPQIYDADAPAGPETFPFTSNCTYDAAVQYYAAFADVTVYDSETLQNVLCTIPEGTALRLNTSDNAGYSIVTLKGSGPQTYSVMLNAFSSMCAGATEGYISVPQTQVLGMTTWLVPIEVVLKGT
jgi:hypothetical protein